MLGIRAAWLWLFLNFSQMHYTAGALLCTNQNMFNKSSGEVNLQHMPQLPVKAEQP